MNQATNTFKRPYLLKELLWFGITLFVGLLPYLARIVILGNSTLDIAFHDTYFVLPGSIVLIVPLLLIFFLSYTVKGIAQKHISLFSTFVWILLLIALLIFSIKGLVVIYALARQPQVPPNSTAAIPSDFQLLIGLFWVIAILALSFVSFRIYSFWKQLKHRHK